MYAVNPVHTFVLTNKQYTSQVNPRLLHVHWEGSYILSNLGIALGNNEFYGWEDLAVYLNYTVKGKLIIVIDSCFANNIIINGLMKLEPSDRNRFTIFAACGTNEESLNYSDRFSFLSDKDYYGIFTYEVGMATGFFDDKLHADTNDDNLVSMSELYDYVRTELSKKTNKTYPMHAAMFTIDDSQVFYQSKHNISQNTGELLNGLKYRIDSFQAHITGYNGSSENVTIPAFINGYPVTEIDKEAFSLCFIKKIVLPGTIKTIGQEAFYGSTLETVELSEGVSSIGDRAFAYTNLNAIMIPDSVKTLGKRVFYSCSSLETVVMPDIVFDGDLFADCKNLNNIHYKGDLVKLKSLNKISKSLLLDLFYINVELSDGSKKKVYVYSMADEEAVNFNIPLFALGRDNWGFMHNTGFSGVKDYSMNQKYYNELIKYLNKSEISFLQTREKEEWIGSCHGLSMIMAMLGDKILSLSDVPYGTGKLDLFHLGVLPAESVELRSYIQYYQLSQYFESTIDPFSNFYNEWAYGRDDNTDELFTKMFALMEQGYWVPFGYFYWKDENRNNFAGHTVLAVNYKRISESHANELIEKGYMLYEIFNDYFRNGYFVQLYNVNRKDDFEYLCVSEDLKKFLLVTVTKTEMVISNIPNNDSRILSLFMCDPKGTPIVGRSDKKGQKAIDGRKISFGNNSDIRLVSSTGQTLEYVNNVLSGTMIWSDMRIATDGSQELSITVEDNGDWTITSLSNSEIALSVYDNDQYMQVSASNADQVNLSLPSGTMNITGSNVIFDVHMTTDEDVLPGQAGHGAISGKGSGMISFRTSGSTVVAESSGEMNNVVSTAYIGNGYGQSEKLNHVNSVTTDTKGYLNLREEELLIPVGYNEQIEITALPAGITEENIKYISSDTSIATVENNGLVTGVKKGTTSVKILANGKELKTVNVKITGSDIYAVIQETELNYLGYALKPDTSVYDGTRKLNEKTDYTVTYKNNTNVYTLKEGEEGFSAKKAPQIIIKAKGNYSGTKTVYFTIAPADISSSDIETLTTAYTGKVQKISPAVVFEGKTLKKGTDYTLDYPDTAENAYQASGTYNITVTGKGNYTGTRTYQMIIGAEAQISLDKASITLEQKSYKYQNGETVKPNIKTVKVGKTVVDPSLYTVSYGENNTVGNGTVTITGKDSETIGTRTVTFKITGTPITKLIKVAVPKSVTRGTELKDVVRIEASLTEGTDYEVTYDETENAGKANIVITGINGYTGTIKKTVTIAKDKLTAANTTVAVPEAVMMKNGAKPAPTVTVNGTELVEGSDYTLSYANNKKAGTGTVTVKGVGNYTGSLKQTFTISAKDLSETTLEYANNVNSSTKKGSYKTTVVIRDEDGGLLKAGTDYTLKFCDEEGIEIPSTSNSSDYVGKKLTTIIYGKGNYTGRITGEYKVVEGTVNLAKASISIKPQQYLSGKPVEITSTDQFSKAAMGKTPLTLGEDFEVYSYSNNTAKGTATVVFKGIGEYSGYKSVTYKIGQRSIMDYWNGVVSFFSRLKN